MVAASAQACFILPFGPTGNHTTHFVTHQVKNGNLVTTEIHDYNHKMCDPFLWWATTSCNLQWLLLLCS